MTGVRLLANDLKQISDCTGGRNSDAVRYCQSEQRYILKLSIINME
ncbi:hypothetical protein SAMN05444375_11943 [Segatella baroniae B14]|nr:hypothetical protein SAMN05444375_11943 [Segatella baroniae B14]